MMCPSSWARMKRCSSRSSVPSVPELMDDERLVEADRARVEEGRLRHVELRPPGAVGGRACVRPASRAFRAPRCRAHRAWAAVAGPTRTALARKRCRMPRSPKKPGDLAHDLVEAGRARRALSAARSAGCSQAVEEIWVSVWRSAIETSEGKGVSGMRALR
jgi:hypothetical protein